MKTVAQPPDISADPQAATPYFRRRAFTRAVDEAAQWYAGGLPPDPLAA